MTTGYTSTSRTTTQGQPMTTGYTSTTKTTTHQGQPVTTKTTGLS